MKCNKCPLYSSWNNENDKGEECKIFGDSWDSRFQYEDKDGNIVGCYIDRYYIEQTEEKIRRAFRGTSKSIFGMGGET